MRLLIICVFSVLLGNLAHAQEYKLRKASNTDCWGWAPCPITYYGECSNGNITGKGTMHLHTQKDGVQKAVGTFYEGKYHGFVTHLLGIKSYFG